MESHRCVRETLGELAQHPLVWCTLPRVGKKASIARDAARAAATSALRLSERQHRSAKPFAKFSVDGGILRLHKTENEMLAVGGATNDLAISSPRYKWSILRAIGRRLAGQLTEIEALLNLEPGVLVKDVFRAFLYRRAASELLDRIDPKSVVYGAEEHIFARAFSLEARLRGISTAFIHHAPFSLEHWAREISASWFLARGEGERDFLKSIGASEDQIVVIGDPSIERLPLVREQTDKVVIGIYGKELARTASLVSEISDALETPLQSIVISPHPRKRDFGAAVARELGVACCQGRTVSCLAQQKPKLFVGTYSSGVRIEAEALGIPTVSLGARSFAFEQEIPTPMEGGGASSLSQQLADLGSLSPEERARRSKRWIWQVGSDARRQRESFLGSAQSAAGPVLSVWGPPPNE